MSHHHRPSARAARRRPALIAGALSLTLAATGCGTRLTGAERAAARAGTTSSSDTLNSQNGGTGGSTGSSGSTGVTAGGTSGSSTGPATTTGGSTSGTSGTTGTTGTSGIGSTGTTGSTGSTGGTTGSGTTTGGGAKSTLLFGSVGTFSGPGGAAWAPGVDGLQLWVKDVNQRGGIDGHPVKLLVADDGNDPARHLSIVKDMVENKHIFTLLYEVVSTTYSKALDDYLTQKGIPAVGGDGSSRFWEGNNMFFPIGTTQSAAFYSHMKAAKLAHPDITKIGVLTCREADGCTQASTGWPEAGKKVGFTTVYNGQVSIAQPDFTAECLNARNAGAQILFVAVDPNSVRRLAQNCTTQSYKPVYALPSGVISSGQSGDPNLDGTLGINPSFPWMSSATPGEQAFQAAVKRYNPSLRLNVTTPFGWTAGKMLEKAAAGRLGDKPTQAAVIAGLRTFKNESLDGIAPPLTFGTKGKSSVCWFTLQFKSGSWGEGNGGRASCP